VHDMSAVQGAGALPRVKTRNVVIVGFDGFQSLDLTGPLEVFWKANLHAPEVGPAPFRYELSIASPLGGTITAESGLKICDTIALSALPADIDTIVISGGSEDALRALASGTPLLAWLEANKQKVRRIASVCTGAFVLAASGLLDGRRATTHWYSCRLLQEMYPAIEVVEDAIFISDDNVYTSAGITSAIDLSLALVEQDMGARVALAVARDLVLYLRRPGGQAQFSASLAAQAQSTGRLEKLLEWIGEHPLEDLSVPRLAREAGMSERNFGRVFVEKTGLTPGRFVEYVRLDRAKLYLETTGWPLARVAEKSGFGGVTSLIRSFSKHLQITPHAYRQRFTLN